MKCVGIICAIHFEIWHRIDEYFQRYNCGTALEISIHNNRITYFFSWLFMIFDITERIDKQNVRSAGNWFRIVVLPTT